MSKFFQSKVSVPGSLLHTSAFREGNLPTVPKNQSSQNQSIFPPALDQSEIFSSHNSSTQSSSSHQPCESKLRAPYFKDLLINQDKRIYTTSDHNYKSYPVPLHKHLHFKPSRPTHSKKFSSAKLKKLQFEIAKVKSKIFNKTFHLRQCQTQEPMSDTVTFFETIRKLAKTTPISLYFSIPPPKNFSFQIKHIKNLPKYNTAKLLFLELTYDYRQLSVLEDLKISEAVKYFYFCEFAGKQYILLYKLVHKISVFNLKFSNIQIVLISQLLCNYIRTTDAPFKSSEKTYEFTDTRGQYKNKYETHKTTLASAKQLDPLFSEDFEFEDYMKINFNFEEHPHIFLKALLKIGWHNPKFDIASLDSPYAGVFIAVYVIVQFKFNTIPQYLFVSKTIFQILLKLLNLPQNTAVINFLSNLGFKYKGVSLKPSPGGHVLICLGYKKIQLNATVFPDYSFSTEKSLTRFKLPSSRPQQKSYNEILQSFREFEMYLTSKQMSPVKTINVSNPLLESCFTRPKPDPNRQWHLIKRYHYEMDESLLNGHDIVFPNVHEHQVLFQADLIRKKADLHRHREKLQANTRCNECGKPHPTEACETNYRNYPLTHPYQVALWQTFISLPQQQVIYLKEISILSLKQLQQKYQQRSKRFWTKLAKVFPHFKNSNFQEKIFIDNYSRSGLLWSIGVPKWLFRQNLVGIILPFLEKPHPVYIKSSFDPTSEEQQFLLKFIETNVPLNVLAPWPKKKSMIISRTFVIELDNTDTSTRPRVVSEFPYLNHMLQYTKFELPTALDTFFVIQGSIYWSLPLDMKSAYWIQPVAKKFYPYVVVAFIIGQHEYFFTWLVAPFGQANLCRVFNRYVRPHLKPLTAMKLFASNYFDNVILLAN